MPFFFRMSAVFVTNDPVPIATQKPLPCRTAWSIGNFQRVLPSSGVLPGRYGPLGADGSAGFPESGFPYRFSKA